MNALEEYTLEVAGKEKVICAYIKHETFYNREPLAECLLPLNATPQQYFKFVSTLSSINYDQGYGSQELYGTIWYEDGSWSERYEYDGSECWHHKQTPPIPGELK